MAPRDYSFSGIKLHPAERKPDGTTTSKSSIAQEEFTTVDLGDDWESPHIRTLHQKGDDEFVRDCPDDTSYEGDRRRYMASSFVPANKTERAAYVLVNAPTYAKTGAEIAVQAATLVARSTSECYAEEGVSGIARSAATSGLSVAGGMATTLVGTVSSTLGGWYGVQSSLARKLERKSSNGQKYSLPNREDIRRGVKGSSLRDLAVDEDLDGEEWDMDDDVEEVYMNSKLRRHESS